MCGKPYDDVDKSSNKLKCDFWELKLSYILFYQHKYRPKKLMKSNKLISRIFFAKFHFLQNWPKINFWTGKKFKIAKNAISQKK